MDKFSRNTTPLFLIFLVLFFLRFQSATLDDEGGQNIAPNEPQKPLLSKILLDTLSLLKKSHESSWEKIKTVIHDLQMQFSPPNLDFRGTDEVGHDGVKETLKDAVEKSFDKSKETVEESAKSAAEVVGEAIHKTSEKVMENTHHSDKETKAEL